VALICLLVTIFLLVTRKMAYIQLFDDHMLMVTPFLHLNIGFRRVQNSTTTQMYKVFPPVQLSRVNLNILDP
jgi:hypothetical protein